jgi:tetratricopeptide (TPR) repeat protein
MLSSTPQKALSVVDAISLTLRVALEHHVHGRLREAATLYREVQGIDPGNIDAIFLLGLVALAVRNHPAALRLLTIAAQRLPRSVFVHRALAEALMRKRQTAAALACCWRALALDPRNVASYVDVAQALIAVKPLGGNDELAAACFRRALQLDPLCAAAHAGLGHLSLRAGKLEAAVDEYRAAILGEQHRAAYHNFLGAALYSSQQYTAAADAFRHALTLQPGSPEIYLNLGNALRALGDPRAEECYRQALRLRPMYPRALHQLVNLLSQDAANPSAMECYRQALATEPGPVEARRRFRRAFVIAR